MGFSYDVPTNGVLPLLQTNNHFIPGVAAPHDGGGHVLVDIRNSNSIKYAIGHTNLLNGTFSSGDMRRTANTTAIAAHAAWHFLQSWMVNFPQSVLSVFARCISTANTRLQVLPERCCAQYCGRILWWTLWP